MRPHKIADLAGLNGWSLRNFRRRYQLTFAILERVTGFEPVSLAWKAKAQPLYHTRMSYIVCILAERVGFEPTEGSHPRAVSNRLP